MSRKKSFPAFRPIDKQSEEYLELLLRLSKTLEIHLGDNLKATSYSEAVRFHHQYEAISLDFWDGKAARSALKQLAESSLLLSEAMSELPILAFQSLMENADQHDEQRKERFLSDFKGLILAKSELPQRGTVKAVNALRQIYDNIQELLDVLEATKRDLPKGIPTRNRQIKEWALIDTTVQFARESGTINIPESLDTQGPLARFFRDVFDDYGLKKTSFRRTYENWRAKFDGKIDESDLTPI